jgi:PAS domain S-box-containing protein
MRFIGPDERVIWILDRGELHVEPTGERTFTGITIDITARKQAEADALAKAALLEVTMENMDQGLMLIDAALRVPLYNRRVLDLLELPADLMRSCPSFEDIRQYQAHSGEYSTAPEDIKPLVKMDGFHVGPPIYQRVRPNGTALEIRTVPLADGGAVRTYTDITAQKRMEAELERSEERLRLAVEATGLATYDYNLRTGERVWSDEIYRIFGLPGDTPLSRDEFGARVHPYDLTEVEKTFDRNIATPGGPYKAEFRIVRADNGQVRWVGGVSRTIADEHGQPARYIGTLRDITERKEAEVALSRSERRLSTLLNNLPGFAYRCLNQPNWPMEYQSEGVRAVVGYAPADFIGPDALGWSDIMHPDDKEPVWSEVQTALKDRRPFELTYRVQTRDGQQRLVWERGRGVYSETGELEALEGFISDITEQRRTEEHLRQSQKMEAIGQLTGGVAHDFNNLLTVILGNAELLAESHPEPDARDLAVMIQQAAEKGADLTQHLLAFGRRQTLTAERLLLGEVVMNLEPLLRRTIGAHIDLVTQIEVASLAALADRTLLESAILNLVVNARDAMPQGGTLTIRVGQTIAGVGEGGLPFGQPVAFVTVSDTGSGMTSDVLARAFDPFYTTKEVGKGTGLGLSMVYGFAEQSGGHVSIESHVGQGTAVTILLRAVSEALARPAPVDATRPSEGQERVLVVEDEASVRRFVCSQLVSLGYEVTAVEAAPDALDLLRDGQEFDLLFTDVVLPKGMSGMELAQQARELKPNLKVLLTSGYSEEVFEHHGRPDENTPLLRKPYKRKALAEMLRQVLHGEQA